MKTLTLVGLSLAAIMTLTGCGSSSSSDDNAVNTTPTKTIKGVAVDPELAGSNVFVDANENGAYDEGELNTTTDANGTYSLDIPESDLDKPLVVMGGRDIVTQKDFNGTFECFIDPNATEQNITPLTTLLKTYIDENNISLQEAKENIANLLDIQHEDLGKNPMKEGNEKLLKVAMQMEVTASMINDETNGTMSHKDVYKKFAKQLKEGVSPEDINMSTFMADIKTNDLVRVKVEALHSAIKKMQSGEFNDPKALALTIDNLDENITQIKDKNKIHEWRNSFETKKQEFMQNFKITTREDAEKEITERKNKIKKDMQENRPTAMGNKEDITDMESDVKQDVSHSDNNGTQIKNDIMDKLSDTTPQNSEVSVHNEMQQNSQSEQENNASTDNANMSSSQTDTNTQTTMSNQTNTTTGANAL